MIRRGFLFEPELVGGRDQMIGEFFSQNVLKNLGRNGGNCDPAVIRSVTDIAIPIFDDRNYGAKTELHWNKRMRHHVVKKRCEPQKKNKWSILEVFRLNTVVILTFSLLHTAHGINHVFDCDFIASTVTILRMIA